ncbi:AAA family ATPase [Pseudomonas fragi]|uniref:TrlF family AAA-like ATPase n=1 Tax=Pseudomonas fragi TaxID=296 RepID=UPI001474C688|nr:AAA family ATPase [Pseudomonas fragi]NNB05472.1 AAA family ATPase [Pseudomonas fragi]
MDEAWPYPGSRWWKFDFHTHTPTSTDTPWHRLIGQPEALTPEQWLLKYMAAEIDCVAVTDHNSGGWIDELKATYSEMLESQPQGFRELHLFPGVEISVSGGIHLLAIFDPSATTSTIDSILAVVGYSGTKGDSDGVSEKSATEVVQAIIKLGGLPIPAHADQSKGLLQLEEGSHTRAVFDSNTLRQVLSQTGILAMEVVNRETAKPTVYTQSGVRWTEVIGSDCHSFKDSYRSLPGSKFTWVKMTKPSLEGLRLALLDGEGVSVRHCDDGVFDPFRRPEHFIESIQIANTRAMGNGKKPALLTFNPYFNALVGGRGTGKSTVIHALRLVYRREGDLSKLDPKSEPSETFERFNKVAKSRNDEGGLKAETALELILSRDGVRHRLQWQQIEPEVTVEEWVAGGWVASSSQAITGQRFPIRLFSQGQIASLAGNGQQAMLDVIDAAAGTDNAKESFQEAKRAFFSSRAQLREVSGRLKGRDANNISLADVQRKLQRFEAAQHAGILNAYQRVNRQSHEIDRQFESQVAFAERIESLAKALVMEDLSDESFDRTDDAEILSVMQKLSGAIADAGKQIRAVAERLTSSAEDVKAELSTSTWKGHFDQTLLAYERLKVELLEQGVSDPSEHGRLVQERQRLEAEAKRFDGFQKQRDELLELIKGQWHKVLEARRGVSETRHDFLQRTLAENPFVRIELIPYGAEPESIERSLRSVLGVFDKYNDDIYSAAQGETPAKGVIADLLVVAALERSDVAAYEAGLQSLQRRLIQGCGPRTDLSSWFSKFLAGVTEKRPEFHDEILCWFPEDNLRIEYSRKGDGQDFLPIGQASAGQRAAAMLAFLLAHGDEPLVLDQPEDDLDNHLIYDLVVKQIRANKLRRQLIIVTHNPNIVVNGDAEMLYTLDFNHQCYVKHQGSLQEKPMREEVCRIMEGGREAFERRYQRLGRDV